MLNWFLLDFSEKLDSGFGNSDPEFEKLFLWKHVWIRGVFPENFIKTGQMIPEIPDLVSVFSRQKPFLDYDGARK